MIANQRKTETFVVLTFFVAISVAIDTCIWYEYVRILTDSLAKRIHADDCSIRGGRSIHCPSTVQAIIYWSDHSLF